MASPPAGARATLQEAGWLAVGRFCFVIDSKSRTCGSK